MSEIKLNLQEFAKELVKGSGYTAPTIATMLGLSKKTFYNWLNGKTTRVDIDFFEKNSNIIRENLKLDIARATNSEVYIRSGNTKESESQIEDLDNQELENNAILVKGNFYPIVSSINAGDPGHIFVKENYEGYIHVDYPSKKNCYVLRVIGTSMECDGPRCIREGELVFVDMSLEVLNGDVVAVRLASGRQMVKQVMFESRDKDADVTLHSFNPLQPDINIKAYDILSMNRVVMVIPKPRWI
jgi:SOS-response transcriptional repressor LexA